MLSVTVGVGDHLWQRGVWLREQILVVWDIWLIGVRRRVRIWNERRRSSSDELRDGQWVSNTNDVLHVQIRLSNACGRGVLVVDTTLDEDAGEVLRGDIEVSFKILEITVAGGLIQEGSESYAGPGADVWDVLEESWAVQLFEAYWGDQCLTGSIYGAI